MKFLHGVSLRRSFAVGVATLFMGLLLYRPGETEEVEPAFQPLAVSTARAAMVERSTGLRLTGTVEGLTSAIISSRYSGQVEEVNVENGQRVYAGQPLFRTDSRELENNLRIAENGVRKARVNFDNIDTNYQRNQKLFEIGAVSQQSMETNVTQREVSLADVADAEENLAIARKRLVDATVTSPVDGVVANKAVNLGQIVSAGTQLMTVEQIDAIYVTIQVQQQDIAKIRIGTKATVKVDAFPDHVFSGEVAVINPVAGRESRLFDVKVRVENQDFSLMPGMFAEAVLSEDGGNAPVLAVPRTALFSHKGQNYVYVLQPDGNAKRVRVEVGELMDEKLEICSGLEEGDTVILDNLDKLKDGDPVNAYGGEEN